WLLTHLPGVGIAGFGAGVDGDLFVGERLWATGSVRYARASEVDVVRRVAPTGAPLAPEGGPRSVRWQPADVLSLRIAPRFRLTEAISLGARYAASRMGESTFVLPGGEADASVLDLEGGFS